MTYDACQREAEVLDCVLAGRWPEATSGELRAHVAGCDSCSELAVIGATIATDHAVATRQAKVPSSGLVWWRAERRARREALQQAATVSIALQAIPITVALAVMAVLAFGAGWVPYIDVSMATLASHWRLLLMVAIPLVTLAPAALYFAVHRD